VAVIGAGVAGLSLAWRLTGRGARVTLLDGSTGGASQVPVALINPYRGRSGRPGRFDVAGAREFWRLARELEQHGLFSGAVPGGVLRVATTKSQLRSWRSREGLEEQTSPPPGLAPAAGYFLAQLGGQVVTESHLRALRALLHASSVQVLNDSRVKGVSRVAAGWQLQGSDWTLDVDVVVLATGASPLPPIDGRRRELGAQYEVNLGELVELQPADEPAVYLPRPVAGPVYLAQLGCSVFVGGNRRAQDRSDVRAPEPLRDSAARLVPALKGWEVASVWVGERLKHESNEPQCLQLDEGLWFLGAFGGRGFLTAALFARQLAERLLPAKSV